jgi:prevent-host-death family protein
MYMNMTFKKDTWQLQDAKAEFNKVINSAAKAPQIIMVEGEETAVVLSMRKYRQLEMRQPSLVEAFRNSPYPEVELELPPREMAEDRDINL